MEEIGHSSDSDSQILTLFKPRPTSPYVTRKNLISVPLKNLDTHKTIAILVRKIEYWQSFGYFFQLVAIFNLLN